MTPVKLNWANEGVRVKLADARVRPLFGWVDRQSDSQDVIMLRTLRRLRWVAALTPALLVQTALANDPVVGDPCPLPCPAPACAVPAARPRIVVHVPPPEVIVQNDCGPVLRPRSRLFGGRGGCDSGCSKPPQQQSLVQTTLTPLSMTTYGSISAFGASFGGASAMQFAPVQQVQQIQTISEDFSGLRAIHDAEIRTAAIVAARSRQDAELRATMAALDRARANMTSVATSSADCKDTTKELVAATTAAVKSTTTLTQQVESLQVRLTTLEQQIRELHAMQVETIKQLNALKK